MTKTHRIFLTQHEDGTFLAASVEVPRFCVGAPTKNEALAKADRAFAYYQRAQKAIQPKAVETRLIAPFFEEREVCVAA